ncbi:ECF RNA polymerase sigma factor SigW [compost metagenome]
MNLYKNLNDQELAILLKKGNEAAFHEIYERYKGILHLHAYKKLVDFEEAKDVVQELFGALWDKRDDLPETVNFSGYLYSSVRNRIFNIYAHKKVAAGYITSFQNFNREESYITDDWVRENELAKQIEAEIGALPERMREVFLLSRKEHLSHKEIAEKLDISEFTVKNHIKKALKILRFRLGLFAYLVFLLKYYFLK